MKKQIILAFLLCILFVGVTVAQKTYTLRACVDIAMDRSLEVQRVNLNGERADINLHQNKAFRLPSLNANTNISTNFGRVIDPTTNAFNTQSSAFQSLGLSTGMPIYRGGQINKSIQLSELSKESSVERVEQLKDNIALSVVQSYLNVMLAQENKTTVQQRIANSRQQLVRINALIRAGSVPATDRFAIEAQVANEEQQLVAAENNIDVAKLSLSQQLRLEEGVNFEIENPNLDRLSVADFQDLISKSVDEVYNIALDLQNGIKADDYDLQAALVREEIEKTRAQPSVNLSGSLNTNYSSLAKRLNMQNPTQFEDVPYIDQVENNIGYGFGVNVSMPIFNNYQVKNNIQQAKINTAEQKINNDLNKQSLRTNIQTAVTSARAAEKTFLAAEKNLTAQKKALEVSEKKMNAGLGSNYEFLIAKNNVDIAEVNVLTSKYDFIFKVKVIDFYIGNEIKLK